MNAQEIISSGILELYCTGLTSAAENAEVQQWAKQYPEVAAEISAIQASLEGYARAHAITPAASVREKLFAEINKSSAAPVVNTGAASNGTAKLVSISSSWKYAAAASVVLLIGSLVFNYSYYSKYKAASNDLQLAKTELEQQKQLAKSMDDDMGIMKNGVPVSLGGTPAFSDAAARIYWMKNTGDVYIDPSRLPKAPDGMQYQFWGIVDGKPVSGGMINLIVDGKAVHMQKMRTFGRAEAFAISLEKAGPEKTAPSPDVVAMGKL